MYMLTLLFNILHEIAKTISEKETLMMDIDDVTDIRIALSVITTIQDIKSINELNDNVTTWESLKAVRIMVVQKVSEGAIDIMLMPSSQVKQLIREHMTKCFAVIEKKHTIEELDAYAKLDHDITVELGITR